MSNWCPATYWRQSTTSLRSFETHWEDESSWRAEQKPSGKDFWWSEAPPAPYGPRRCRCPTPPLTRDYRADDSVPAPAAARNRSRCPTWKDGTLVSILSGRRSRRSAHYDTDGAPHDYKEWGFPSPWKDLFNRSSRSFLNFLAPNWWWDWGGLTPRGENIFD